MRVFSENKIKDYLILFELLIKADFVYDTFL